MRNIYHDALMISDGASNPSGVCHTILETIRYLREQGESTEDSPALALMVHQLAHLTGALRLEHDNLWSLARDACKAKCE